jgi:biotin operon repressor
MAQPVRVPEQDDGPDVAGIVARRLAEWREAHPAPRPEEPPAGKPLPPLVGAVPVPPWTIRPGAHPRLVKLRVADCMPLYLLIYSRNGTAAAPCFASRESLGASIGLSRATVTRQLKRLKAASLVFEVDRGFRRGTKAKQVPARWALDPHRVDVWPEKIVDRLEELRRRDGRDGRWLANAKSALTARVKPCKELAEEMTQDLPRPLRPKSRPSPRMPSQGGAFSTAQNGPVGGAEGGGAGGAKRDAGNSMALGRSNRLPQFIPQPLKSGGASDPSRVTTASAANSSGEVRSK